MIETDLLKSSDCVLCNKPTSFIDRQFYEDPKTKGFLHSYCAKLIMKGDYKWNEETKTYERAG